MYSCTLLYITLYFIVHFAGSANAGADPYKRHRPAPCTRALLANNSTMRITLLNHYHDDHEAESSQYISSGLLIQESSLRTIFNDNCNPLSSWWHLWRTNQGTQMPLLGLSKPFWEIGQVLMIARSLRRIEMVFRLGSAGANPNGWPPYWYSSTIMMAGFCHHGALELIVDLLGCPQGLLLPKYQWTIQHTFISHTFTTFTT